jgi:hypothetical protein
MSSEGLPPGFDLLFSGEQEAARRVLDVDLPPGRLVEPQEEEGGARNAPAYWLSDEPADPELWARLRQAHTRSGLWPVFAKPLNRREHRPWAAGEVSPQPVTDIRRVSAGDVLAGLWAAWIRGDHHLSLEGWPGSDDPLELACGFTLPRDDGFEELEPFGVGWPGLAPTSDGQDDPDQFTDEHVFESEDDSRIMLVPAARSADVLTVVGWHGAVNYVQPISLLSSVLRSWEDRFGARLIEVGFATLHLAVAAPPVSLEHAERVAAEHFAFCPDNIYAAVMSPNTIRGYAAEHVLGKADWWFWWD